MHTFGKSLKSGKRLTTVPLLDTDMDVVLGLLLLVAWEVASGFDSSPRSAKGS